MKRLLWLILPAFLFVDWALPPNIFGLFGDLVAAQTVQNSNPSPGPIGILSSNVAVCDPANPTICITPQSPFPSGATPKLSVGNGANATTTAFITSATGRTAYITGFMVTGLGATSAAVINVTVSSLLGGNSFNVPISVPAGVTVPISPPVIVNFPSPIPANATNTAISLSMAAFGSGNTSETIVAFGYLI